MVIFVTYKHRARHTMKQKSLVTIAGHSREKIEYLIQMAQEFERQPNRKILDGRVVATLFFEPSAVQVGALVCVHSPML